MEDPSTASALTDIYTEVCRAPADTRVINAWTRAIQVGSKSLQDFAEFLTMRTDYKIAVNRRYKQALDAMLSAGEYDDNAFDVFFSSFTDDTNRVRIIRDADISAHVRSLPQFRKHYEALVHKVADILRGQGPPAESASLKFLEHESSIIQECVELFCMPDSTFDMDQLHTKLLEHFRTTDAVEIDDELNSANGMNQFRNADANNASNLNGAANLNSNDAIEINQSIQPIETATSPSTATSTEPQQPQSERSIQPLIEVKVQAPGAESEELRRAAPFLQTFEEVFRRKMFVEEFIWHGPQILSSSAEDIRELHKSFAEAYNRVREVYVAYIDDQGFDVYRFVQMHLHEYSTPDFLHGLPPRLIDTDRYVQCMSTKLRGLYRSFYDDDLDAAGFEYLFRSVRSRSMGVHDEDLPARVRAFRDETDTIVENIYFVYTSTFMRSPEEDELHELVQEYRTRLRDEQAHIVRINEDVSIRLMATLEFHDVIKGKLKLVSQQQQHQQLAHSALYLLLQAALKALPACRSMVDVDETIQRILLLGKPAQSS
jgi:hypothetical protein